MEKENKEENRADFSKSFEQKTRNFADFFLLNADFSKEMIDLSFYFYFFLFFEN